MASYQGHLTCSTILGAAYGALGIWYWNLDWGTVFLGAGLTALGGMLPDLDSDSGVPIRELFGVSAAAVPFLVYTRLRNIDLTMEQTLALLCGLYLFIRYGLSKLFKMFTVHRGMYHSVPGMFISGLIVYLLYTNPNQHIRIFLAVGTMLGFLSHLILDELYSVDFQGLQIKVNKFAGSALKLYSSSWKATVFCYLVLAALSVLSLVEGDVSKLHDEIVARIKGQ